MIYMSIFIEHWWQPRAWRNQTKISKQAQICAESCEAVPIKKQNQALIKMDQKNSSQEGENWYIKYIFEQWGFLFFTYCQ